MLRFLRSVLLGWQALVTDFERVLSGMERIPRRVFMSSCLESWNHGYETIFSSLFAVRSRSCVCGTLAAADWYNGDVPIKIHAHPGSCASAQPRQGMPEFSRKEGFYLYRTKPGSDCLPVYSSAPD